MNFKIISAITEIIAKNTSIRELPRLEKIYGKGSWRKMKGLAQVKLNGGQVLTAEIHWYEAHGIGKKEEKIKKFL